MTSGLQRVVVFSVVIAFFVCANIIGPWLISNSYPSDFMEYCAFFASGGLVAEACLLATWLALGTLALKYRLPLTVALLLVAACSFVIGLQLAEGGMPLDVAVIIIAAAFALYCCMQVPLWVMRAIARQRIGLPDTGSLTTRQDSTQFGLRYLLACTAAVGVLLVIVKHSLPEEPMTGDAPWAEILGAICVFMAFSGLIWLPCVWLPLTHERRILWAVWLAIVGIGGPPAVYAGLTVMFGPAPDAVEIITAIFLFGLGVGGTTFLVLLVARFLGYRLVAASSLAGPQVDASTMESMGVGGKDGWAAVHDGHL